MSTPEFNEQIWRWLNLEDPESLEQLKAQFEAQYDDSNVRLLQATPELKSLMSEVGHMFYSLKYDDFNIMNDIYCLFLFHATGIISHGLLFVSYNNAGFDDVDFAGCMTRECDLVKVLGG